MQLCKIAEPKIWDGIVDYLKDHYPEILTGIGIGGIGGALYSSRDKKRKKDLLRNTLIGALVGGAGLPAGLAGIRALRTPSQPYEPRPQTIFDPPFASEAEINKILSPPPSNTFWNNFKNLIGNVPTPFLRPVRLKDIVNNPFAMHPTLFPLVML